MFNLIISLSIISLCVIVGILTRMYIKLKRSIFNDVLPKYSQNFDDLQQSIEILKKDLYQTKEYMNSKISSFSDNLIEIRKNLEEIPNIILSQITAQQSYSLSPAKKEILMLLRKKGPLSSAEIARILNRELSNVSKDLGELEKMGYVRRDKTSRPFRCYLSDKIKIMDKKGEVIIQLSDKSK